MITATAAWGADSTNKSVYPIRCTRVKRGRRERVDGQSKNRFCICYAVSCISRQAVVHCGPVAPCIRALVNPSGICTRVKRGRSDRVDGQGANPIAGQTGAAGGPVSPSICALVYPIAICTGVKRGWRERVDGQSINRFCICYDARCISRQAAVHCVPAASSIRALENPKAICTRVKRGRSDRVDDQSKNNGSLRSW